MAAHNFCHANTKDLQYGTINNSYSKICDKECETIDSNQPKKEEFS
jgi:hypothetical protein